MSDRHQAEAMLSKANEDLRALGGMADRDQFVDAIFGFHAQQAVEKALKAWLCLLGECYPRVHDLDLLIDLLAERVEDVTALRELSYLTAFAVGLRYEDLTDDILIPDRGALTAAVRQVVQSVERLLAGAK